MFPLLLRGFSLTFGISYGNVRCFCVRLDKDRELGEAQAEIKALRLSERAREKAVEEVITNSPPPSVLQIYVESFLFCSK